MHRVDIINTKFISFTTFDNKEAKWKTVKEEEEFKVHMKNDDVVNDTLIKDLPEVLPFPKTFNNIAQFKAAEGNKENAKQPNFYFSVNKQSIGIVNEDIGEEYVIIKQRALCDTDCLSEPFITYSFPEN